MAVRGGEMGPEGICAAVGSCPVCPFDSPMRGQVVVKDQCAGRQRWEKGKMYVCCLFCSLVIDLITKRY